LKEFSDIEIIDCLRRRESYVVKYLSDKYLPVIRLMVLKGGGSSEDANDIFQDGLIIMLEKIDDGFDLRCKFSTYLYCVCENLWNTVLDKRRAAANYASNHNLHDHEADLADIMESELHQKIFREVFGEMDQSSRDLLNMHWQDIPLQEIADRLGFTYGYVRKKKCEAQNELIARFKKHPEYIGIVKSEKKARDVVKR
jgi:RNA polymerase sigma factor (sigma-70 family)